MAIPKGLEPTGVILADKPAGPSSFAIVARVRAGTGARTGHAGTLDPFATGLLVLLSGRATSHQARFMKLDKRYVTDLDLRARTSTGDREGFVVEAAKPRGIDRPWSPAMADEGEADAAVLAPRVVPPRAIDATPAEADLQAEE